jgi:hypothetical protein
LQPSAAKFKNLTDFVKSYKHAEQTMSGKLDGYIKPPAADATPEDRNAFLKSIGIAAPEKPEDYALKPEDNSPHAAAYNAEHAKAAEKLFHGIGLTGEQAKALFNFQLEASAAAMADEAREGREFLDTRTKELNQMFGQNASAAVTKAKQMYATIDPNADLTDVDILGASFVAGLARLADRLSPDILANQQQIGNKLSGSAQAMDIISNPSNADYAAYHDNMHPQHKAITAKVLALYGNAS